MSHKTTPKKTKNKTLNPPMCVYLSITGQKKNKQTQKKKTKWWALTGSRRTSSVSRRAALGFSCMSSLHSLSEAGGDSARSGNSSLVLGPRKRILSRRFSMVNTAHLGFTLTWRTATLRAQNTRAAEQAVKDESLTLIGKQCLYSPVVYKTQTHCSSCKHAFLHRYIQIIVYRIVWFIFYWINLMHIQRKRFNY